jgi:hypothetical protein
MLMIMSAPRPKLVASITRNECDGAKVVVIDVLVSAFL